MDESEFKKSIEKATEHFDKYLSQPPKIVSDKNQQKPSKKAELESFYHPISQSSYDELFRLKKKLDDE